MGGRGGPDVSFILSKIVASHRLACLSRGFAARVPAKTREPPPLLAGYAYMHE